MKKFWSKMAAVCLAMVMAAVSAGGSVMASTGTTDIIEQDRDCSLTIYKYDLAAYESDHGSIEDLERASNGEAESEEVTNALRDYALWDVEFGMVRVGKMLEYYDETDGSLTLCYGIPNDLAAVLGLDDGDTYPPVYYDFYGFYTASQINTALSVLLADGNSGKSAVEAWLLGRGSNVKYGTTDYNGQIVFDELNDGLYLVVETGVPSNVGTTTDPFFVSLPMTDPDGDSWIYDVYVYPKNQTSVSTIDKLVLDSDSLSDSGTDTYKDVEDASEGDILNYRIVTEMPTITSEATYLSSLVVRDVQSEGLYYNEDVQIWWYQSESEARSDTAGTGAAQKWTSGSEYFTPVYSGTTTVYERNEATDTLEERQVATGTMTLALTEAGLSELNRQYSDYYMTVVYTSTMYSGSSVVLGDAGNPNAAILTWKRGSSEEYIIADVAEVYSYGISGYFTTKVEEASPFKTFTNSTGIVTDVDASNAAFVLYNADRGAGYYVKTTQINSITGASDGVTYYVVDDEEKYYMDLLDVSAGEYETLMDPEILEEILIRPNSDGYLRIEGLEAGRYILTEVYTVDGYSLLSEYVGIDINSTSVDIVPDTENWCDWGRWLESCDLTDGTLEMLYEGMKMGASSYVSGAEGAMGAGVVGESNRIISDNGYLMLNIENTSTFDLPQTGGMGTILFTLAGAVVVILGIAFVTGSRGKGRA
ncbi:MAG: SpaH/EbpB family LPXTG-anchored major pilin [Lachnospiraceae bacterium]|nr:SpaH/EbpB family LPXTG-anchored major pilin [Lachnospiraceae bacterium]